jgi:hypothetical protein
VAGSLVAVPSICSAKQEIASQRGVAGVYTVKAVMLLLASRQWLLVLPTIAKEEAAAC